MKKPERVYYEMYQSVREKAKKARQEAMLAYLEAKNIKKHAKFGDLTHKKWRNTRTKLERIAV